MIRRLIEALEGRSKEKTAAEEVERIVRQRCPVLRMTPANRRTLKEAIQEARGRISAWMDKISGPVSASPARWEADPVLHAVFVDADALDETLRRSMPLRRHFKAAPEDSSAAALLTAQWREKTAFGTAKSGEILRRDVLQTSVSFEDHKLIAPAPDLPSAREALERKTLDFLCAWTSGRLEDLKNWQAELEKQRDLLKFKIEQSGSRPGDGDMDEEARVLDAINRKIRSIKADLGKSEDEFRYILQALSQPEDFLAVEEVVLNIDRMNILQSSQAETGTQQVRLARFREQDGPPKAALWVTVSRADVF